MTLSCHWACALRSSPHLARRLCRARATMRRASRTSSQSTPAARGRAPQPGQPNVHACAALAGRLGLVKRPADMAPTCSCLHQLGRLGQACERPCGAALLGNSADGLADRGESGEVSDATLVRRPGAVARAQRRLTLSGSPHAVFAQASRSPRRSMSSSAASNSPLPSLAAASSIPRECRIRDQRGDGHDAARSCKARQHSLIQCRVSNSSRKRSVVQLQTKATLHQCCRPCSLAPASRQRGDRIGRPLPRLSPSRPFIG